MKKNDIKLVNFVIKYPKAAKLLTYIAENDFEKRGVICQSEIFEKKLGISKSSITEQINLLVENQLITVTSFNGLYIFGTPESSQTDNILMLSKVDILFYKETEKQTENVVVNVKRSNKNS